MRTGVVALVGRPNVGKSTLFNRLCKSRDALVHNVPGLTRDRKYGKAAFEEDVDVTVIDTGGLLDSSQVAYLVNAQIEHALAESDLSLLIADARDGLVQTDVEIVESLRRKNIKFKLVINKVDGLRSQRRLDLVEFERLGIETPLCISASHGEGIAELEELICSHLNEAPAAEEVVGTPVAVIGRPNVGKSTLVNTIVGDERCIVFDLPGTTRDTIRVPFKFKGRSYTVMDTAGIRRRSRVDDSVEKFSVIKALDAIDAATVALLLIDANEGLVEQDMHLIQFAAETGTGLVLVVNKWDQLDAYKRKRVRLNLERKLSFAEWIPVQYISALNRTGVHKLLPAVDRIHKSGQFEVSTSKLTNSLVQAVQNHPPPTVHRRVIKLKLAQNVGSWPPKIVIHGNQTQHLASSYIRYLENYFRREYDLVGMPITLKFQNSDNPFKSIRNALTRRQLQHRHRLIERRKGRSR